MCLCGAICAPGVSPDSVPGMSSSGGHGGDQHSGMICEPCRCLAATCSGRVAPGVRMGSSHSSSWVTPALTRVKRLTLPAHTVCASLVLLSLQHEQVKLKYLKQLLI